MYLLERLESYRTGMYNPVHQTGFQPRNNQIQQYLGTEVMEKKRY